MKFKKLIFFCCLLLLLAFSLVAFNHKIQYFIFPNYYSKQQLLYTENANKKIKSSAAQLKSYIINNGYNATYCFIINMAMHSGQPRFYVYNLKKDSIEKTGLVTHGSGSKKSNTELIFSNTPNSLATSLGKYKIGEKYFGQFGLAYKLYGLDITNSNAFIRSVVLHSHSCVPASTTYPQHICLSWGCPTVAPSFLKSLQQYIDSSNKPILLSIEYLK